MKRVVIESPYAGDVEKNVRYAKACMKDSFNRGEAPYVSHLLYTQVLDDKNRDERRLGMKAGMIWQAQAEIIAVYTDLGVSSGMLFGIDNGEKLGILVEYRTLGNWE